MAVKARELEGMTKAELIKALRASAALEAKLQKRIAKLEGMKAAPPPLHPDGLPVVTHVEPGDDTVSELTPQDAEAHDIGEAATKELARRSRSRAAGKHAAIGAGPDCSDVTSWIEPGSPAPGVFPWEKK